MRVSQILDDIDLGSITLPVFQRGYVWDRGRVKKLMNSLYQGWPVGSLLIWRTEANSVDVRPGGQTSPLPYMDLLLDGQQRVTSLYGIARGTPPGYFEEEDASKAKAFANLYFDVESEQFEFYNARTMATRPQWIPVTRVFLDGPEIVVRQALSNTVSVPMDRQLMYLTRVKQIENILDADIHHETIGAAKPLDDVIKIFHAVNSGGRVLSQGELALARVGAEWPQARAELRNRLSRWQHSGFDANLDWLLRCVTVLATNASEFTALNDQKVPVSSIQQSLENTERAVDILLETARTHLGIDDSNIHRSKQAFPVMVKYLVDHCGGDFVDESSKARLLHWYVSASIWGRYSGPTETLINEDLRALESEGGPLETLRGVLLPVGTDGSVHPRNFDAVRTNARFFPLLYMMSRVWGARDWQVPMPVLPDLELGTRLQLHHIFPKAVLRKQRQDLSREALNNFGNLAFISRDANLAIGEREPADYLAEIAEHYPHALQSQWVPDDPELWKVENYERFLEERRRLLAASANDFFVVAPQRTYTDSRVGISTGGFGFR